MFSVNCSFNRFFKAVRIGTISALSLFVIIGLISEGLHVLPVSEGYSGTSVYVDPAETVRYTNETNEGDLFTVSLNVGNVSDLCGIDYKLYWNKSVINVVSWQSAAPWSSPFVASDNFTNDFNATHGRGWFTVVSLSGGFSGDWTFNNVTFMIVGSPPYQTGAEISTTLELAEVVLGNSLAQPIPCDAHNGVFSYVRYGEYVDTVPPTISNVNRIPTNPPYNLAMIVSAKIQDLSGVSTVVLSFNHTGTWENDTMYESEGLYYGVVPAPQPSFSGVILAYRIYANDTAGNWGVSNFYYYLGVDTVLPKIGEIGWSPTCPSPYVQSSFTRAYESTLVLANVTEPWAASGVKAVRLRCRINAGGWWDTTMSYNATLGKYVAKIPGQEGNSLVEFYVQAEDNAGNIASSVLYSFTVKPSLIGDVNGDGEVNILDLIIVASHLGQHWP